MERIAKLLGGSLAALWLTILTIGPLLGSFITEPAAMTISALLLSEKFFELGPSNRFKYATLGLLFVNISVGGTLTHFAAPPVLMVAEPWGWGAPGFMPLHFGWKAALGILMSNGLYFLWFRKEISTLQHDYELGVVRDDIEQRFVTRSRIQKEFERIVVALKADQTLFASISETTAGVVDEIRKRMEAEMLPGLKEEGVDPELIREAFDKRFEEVRMAKMRELLPGLLPEDEREYIDPHWDEREDSVPFWVTAVHILFMGWTIANAHYPPLFVIGMLFFLGFAQITMPYQNRIRLQAPMLVGFFLAGLVIHGGVQGWWIAPVLGSLSEWPLMITATVLTAFNDNAAITYLATLVPGFTDSLKYAVVAGAVSGGGLTIIANAPNPAGQSILKRHFDNAVSPAGLLMAALIPTIIVFLCYALL
jgi:Na+/H+ antiporter NhaD/arsenite permease-like protein